MGDLDNLTPLRARRLGGPYTQEERAEKQTRFIEVYRQCGNIKYSCQMAGISREMFYQWKKNNKTFQRLVEEAEPEVDDTVEYAAFEEGVIGVEEPVVSSGKVMYVDEEVLNEDGTPQLDSEGKPVTKRKMLTIRRRNPTVLITLLKARLPQKYREKQQVEHSGSVDVAGAKETLFSKLSGAVRTQDGTSQESPTK